MRLEPGSRLGPYEITSAIGAGGMGEVYRARDTRLGREVAIKVLPRELTRDPERLARFEREARSASALNHRNIVTVHDFTADDRETWLVMELVRGESLRDIVSRGGLPAKQLLAIGAGIADGLAAAHAAGIVHRDLKPENVMVAPDATVKILDFGLVKQNSALSHPSESPTELAVTRAGVVMGTIDYMSPEQARGEDVDFRTDHFSLGVMLYELAAGTHPFRRATAAETMAAILKEEPAPLDQSFGWVLERCLVKRPDGRYGSTSDLAHDLHRLGLAPSGPHRQSTGSVGGRRGWWPLITAAVGVASVALGAALATWRRPAAVPEGSYQATVATPEIAQVFRDEVALPLALSPDGRHLVIYGTDVDGIPALWLRDLRSGTTRLVAQNTFSVGWSGDGRSIAYISGGKLMTAPVDGGPARAICDARPEGTPTWRGDTILFTQYSTDPPGIFRVNAAGGTPQPVVSGTTTTGDQSAAWWPEFLPDGTHFFFVRITQQEGKWEAAHELWIGSLDGSPERMPLTIDSRVAYAGGNLLYVREGTLLAQPFDPDTRRLSGEARPIVDGVHYFRNTGLAAFSVSENGVLAWRARRSPSSLTWLDRAGTELRSIGNGVFMPPGRLSPDGTRYAVTVVDPKLGVGDVWVYDLDRDSSERVTFRGSDDIAPVWAADRRSIFFRTDCCAPPDIYRWSPDEEEPTLVYGRQGVEEPQDASPDGKWLLFVDHRQAGAADILVLPLAAPGPARPFVATPFNEFSPRFSPDGKWVAYESNISGRPEIYVRLFEGAAQPARVSRDGGTRPRWRRDGRELFFLGTEGRVMTVAMSGGAAAAAPRLLFQATAAIDFEPSVDGARFLMQLEQRTAEPPVHLLVNWPARLRAER